jgi:hypothetical protein
MLAHALGRANRIKPSTPEERKSSSKIIVTLLNFKTDIETKVKRASADGCTRRELIERRR